MIVIKSIAIIKGTITNIGDSGTVEVGFRLGVALTNPDCRQMMNYVRVESCYIMQAAVDSKNHLIVNYLVTN